jgi:hypothetical protein
MRHSIKSFLLPIVAVALCLVLFFQLRGNDSRRIALVDVAHEPTSGRYKRPKITVISVWSIYGKDPNYIPLFIQSVEANKDIDLLFVQVDRAEQDCPTYSNAPNIQVRAHASVL